MKILRGTLMDGRVELDPTGLPDGAVVAVLVPDEEPFDLSPEEVAELRLSIAEADRGEVVDAWQLLTELHA